MIVHPGKSTKYRQISKVKGSGLLNKLIDNLPIELHLPGYRFCGPGTKLSERLKKGEIGINPLDEACKEHDIVYSKSKENSTRSAADKILENKAFQRFKSSNTSVKERIAALGVASAMKAKRKLGMGLKKNKFKTKKGKGYSIRRKTKKAKRIIPIPKKGGFLPLLFPILGALGALGGGAAGIAKAVNDAKANQAQLEELKRHNLVLENKTKGKGFYLAPFKKNFK